MTFRAHLGRRRHVCYSLSANCSRRGGARKRVAVIWNLLVKISYISENRGKLVSSSKRKHSLILPLLREYYSFNRAYLILLRALLSSLMMMELRNSELKAVNSIAGINLRIFHQQKHLKSANNSFRVIIHGIFSATNPMKIHHLAFISQRSPPSRTN